MDSQQEIVEEKAQWISKPLLSTTSTPLTCAPAIDVLHQSGCMT
jgi:hypothetical protein